MGTKKVRSFTALGMVLLASMALSGCGGSDSNNGTNTPNPGGSGSGGSGSGGSGSGGSGSGGSGSGGGGTPAPLTGVFLDAAVQGLRYTASPSGLTGTTDSTGAFNYREGDTVTFAMGELVLGSVPAQGVVTPVTVAEAVVAANPTANMETVAVNLLVFLQSLDADGNAENGITLSSALDQVVTAGAIDFKTAAADFTTNLSSLVTSLEAAVPSLDLTVVSREQATEHFTGQAAAIVPGTYVWANEDGTPVTQNTRTLTLFQNGRYVYGGHDEDANCNGDGVEDANGNGVEMGAFTFNPLTRALTFTASFETNGSCGPANAEGESYELTIAENLLTIDFGDEVTHWAKVPQVEGGVGGAWAHGRSLVIDRPLTVALFPASEGASSGRYFMADAMWPQPDAEYNVSSGIEEGCYSIGSGGALTVDLDTATCPGAVDTNDEAGLSSVQGGSAVEVDEHGRLRFFEGGEHVTSFVRLPLQDVTVENIAGAYYFEELPGEKLQEMEFAAFMTIFSDGKYLGAVQEDGDDWGCDGNNYPMPHQNIRGSGVEYGDLGLVSGAYPGLFTPTADIDTTGTCGLVDVTTDPVSYLFVRTQEGSLLYFPPDEDEEFGYVMKPLETAQNSELGAWLLDGTDEGHPVMLAFMPDNVVFTMSAAAGEEAGLAREAYAVNAEGTGITITTDEVDFCVDTIGVTDNCHPDNVITDALSFSKGAGTITIDGATYTKYPAP